MVLKKSLSRSVLAKTTSLVPKTIISIWSTLLILNVYTHTHTLTHISLCVCVYIRVHMHIYCFCMFVYLCMHYLNYVFHTCDYNQYMFGFSYVGLIISL